MSRHLQEPGEAARGIGASASLRPCSTTSPPSTTAMASTSSRVARRWATMMAVRPASSACIAAVMCASVAGSSRLDASSRITTAGSARNALANARSWASPAETLVPPSSSASRPPAWAASQSPRPTSWRTSSSCSSSTSHAPKSVRLSRSEARNSSTSWVTTATWRRRERCSRSRTSTPPMVTRPLVTSQSRSTSRPRVVLPLPVRPTMPRWVPAGISRSTSRTASGASGW